MNISWFDLRIYINKTIIHAHLHLWGMSINKITSKSIMRSFCTYEIFNIRTYESEYVATSMIYLRAYSCYGSQPSFIIVKHQHNFTHSLSQSKIWKCIKLQSTHQEKGYRIKAFNSWCIIVKNVIGLVLSRVTRRIRMLHSEEIIRSCQNQGR